MSIYRFKETQMQQIYVQYAVILLLHYCVLNHDLHTSSIGAGVSCS